MVSVPTVLKVGEWTVDPATNELRRRDQATRIEPKSMQVLRVLAERAGSVVTREELFQAAWPGMVVGDEALSQTITKLRRALGDDPRSPRYIETISKRGYRLTAAVGTAAAPPAQPASRPGMPRWLAVAAVMVPLIWAAAWMFDSPPPVPADRQEAWTTVTVMPFEWIGGDPGQAWFARGMSESLATDLGRLASLRLIGSAGATPAEAARRARYVVSGSVQRDAARLRVNVRLADTRTGEQLWSERYERPAAELFAIQDEIVGRLAQS